MTFQQLIRLLLVALIACTFGARADEFAEGSLLYEVEKYHNAFPLLMKAAELGNVRAMSTVGNMLREGQGVARNEAQGLFWVEKAANLGLADAQADMGRIVAGDAPWTKGKDVQERALAWYLKAAEQGHAGGQYNAYQLFSLRLHYDPVAARNWLEKAADQGYANALNDLGIEYNRGGLGLPEDIVRAYMYFSLAFKHGYVMKMNGHVYATDVSHLTRFLPRMTSVQIAEGDRLVKEWEDGHPQTIKAIATHPSGSESGPGSENEAVISEIKALVMTKEALFPSFIVREATPQRIDRLFSTPEIVNQPAVVRETGLILAGRGTALSFDKPSDIQEKIAKWFPHEIGAARAANNPEFSDAVHLYGPYLDWNAESSAFLMLWRCMPQIAWLKPNASPFVLHFDTKQPFKQIALFNRDDPDTDFGHCVRFDAAFQDGPRGVERLASPQEGRQIQKMAIEELRHKFHRFLGSNGCRGTGPDDCVLILLMWASLSSEDVRLADALGRLEADVAPEKFFQPEEAVIPKEADRQLTKYGESLRVAAFLRAKLLSIGGAPAAWPQSALGKTFRQMTRVTQWQIENSDKRFANYSLLNGMNDHVNPWSIHPASPDFQPGVEAELDAIADEVSCTVHEEWFKYGGATTASKYVLRKLFEGRVAWCGTPDWQWMKTREPEAGLELRKDDYVALVDRHKSGAMHDMFLSGLTDYGEACFHKSREPWLRRLCSRWISEPMAVRSRLKHSRLVLTQADKFRATNMGSLPLAMGNDPKVVSNAQTEWLMRLTKGRYSDSRETMGEFARQLHRGGTYIFAAKRWWHPRRDLSVLEFGLGRAAVSKPGSPASWPTMDGKALLVMKAGRMSVVRVPQRFAYQYDDGEIVHVSDLDRDGQPEIWFSGTFGECDGDDLRPGVDCAISVTHLGEVFGDAVSYFRHDKKKRKR